VGLKSLKSVQILMGDVITEHCKEGQETKKNTLEDNTSALKSRTDPHIHLGKNSGGLVGSLGGKSIKKE